MTEMIGSTAARICHRQINCETGGATVFSVRLADGFLLDCGSGGYAMSRARILAEIINEVGAERLSLEGMRP